MRRGDCRQTWWLTGLSLALMLTLAGVALAQTSATQETPRRVSAPCPLVAVPVDAAPVLDGQVDDLWLDAPVLRVPMTYGARTTQDALPIDLRAVHFNGWLYFLAEWSGAASTAADGVNRNVLTLRFHLDEPWPGAGAVACLVACHSAVADDDSRLAYVVSETIPPGHSDPLPSGGEWEKGTWRLEWGRPLVSGNALDLQFVDLARTYPFFAKVFAWEEGRPDPVSPLVDLAFLQ